ncbi:MAG: MATE family efflux transporter [Oscillospiraceae bacterium]
METTSVLLTEGSISKKIIKFAVPVFWGNLFQQLYNVVDSIVVGKYVGKSGLAAVSSTASLIFLLVGLFGGLFMGAGVVISKYFGAKDEESVQEAIHTSIAFGLIAGIVLAVVGTIFSPFILRLMGTPEAVFPNAVLYVRIYFAGILSVVLFNTASGIFQAVGDSKRPLYFLIVSSILNVILDILFVKTFSFGIGGAAIATIISQSVSVVLAFYYLCRTNDIYKVSFKKISIDFQFLKEILHLGIPSGIQNSVIALANIVVQSNINFFGDAAVAGCGAYSKIEGFTFIPITSFSLSMTTFISQNLGAKKYDRAKKGSYFGIAASLILAEIVGIVFYLFAPQFISIFNSEPDVIAFGVMQAKTISLFYFLLAFSHCIAGILRGAGKSVVPMIVMFTCWCVIRVTYVTIATYFIPDIKVVFWAYPLTWSLSSAIFLVYYLKSKWIYGLK